MLGVIGDAPDYGPLVIRVSISMMLISVFGVCLRIFAQRLVKQQIHVDDWLVILVALPIGWGMTAVHIIAAQAGLGKHVTAAFTSLAAPRRFFKLMYIAQIFYLVAVCVVKFSILAFYRRIFGISTVKIPLLILEVIVGVSTIVSVFFSIFLCSPVSAFWDRQMPYYCISQTTMYLAVSIPELVTDVVIMMFPMPLIWNLKLPLSQKLSLTGIFGIAAFIIVIAALRLATVFYSQSSLDVTYVFTPLALFNVIEVNVAIFMACLPSLGPLLRLALGKRASSTQESSRSSRPKSRYSTECGYWSKNKSKENRSSFARLEDPSGDISERGCGMNKSGTRQTIQSSEIELSDFTPSSERVPGKCNCTGNCNCNCGCNR